MTKKSEAKTALEKCILAYQKKGVLACSMALQQHILNKKVKFPLMQFCGHMRYQHIPEKSQIELCDQLEAQKNIGVNVIIGIILQNKLSKYVEATLQKTTAYFTKADACYACDIIGERKFGHALLHHTNETIPKMKELAQHPSNLLVRSLGVGFHNTIKWGLDESAVKQLFKIMLDFTRSKDKEIKPRVGWGPKTTAKFHPEMISLFQSEIEDVAKTGQWFRTKIRIGPERNRYAAGD